MSMLAIIRGLPGVGKTTLANKMSKHVYSADDFFTVDGVYKFDPSKLKEAHEQCYVNTANALLEYDFVCVANTFTQKWEYERYIQFCINNNILYFVVDLYDQGMNDDVLARLNTHGVPATTIARMRSRYER